MTFHAMLTIPRISSHEYVSFSWYTPSPTHHKIPQLSALGSSTFPRRPQQPLTPSQQQQQPLPQQPFYIVVFGYPPDKYSLTAEYFRSSGGESTEPDPNLEITNCFRIGYKDAGDALRAVRKNGEVLGGSWMVGVKWAVCFFFSSSFRSCALGLT